MRIHFLQILLIFLYPIQLWTYTIALHAQVLPSKEKVVGSVITTDGLKAAFLRRSDIERCEVFYPGYYRGYVNSTWDFLIIEGWFLQFHEFIQVSRNLFPDMKIFFYCLDPVYPGMSNVLRFHVDGIATNSFTLFNELQKIGVNSDFIMLAADPEVMRRNSSIQREFGAVYVGAGGHMLEQKPELRTLLLEAVPFGLRLHGIGWENIPVFSEISRGPLLREDLADAYSSGKVVLASTIKSQEDMSMINNRIFEALSCESVVVAQYSPVLEQYFGGVIQFLSAPSSARLLYERLLLHSKDEELEKLRKLGRQVILQHHTWDHRAVQFMNFMVQTLDSSSTLRNSPLLLWIESKESINSLDYLFLKETFLSSYLNRRFRVEIVSEAYFRESFLSQCFPTIPLSTQGSYTGSINCTANPLLGKYHAVFAIAEPFSELDWMMTRLPVLLLLDDKSQIQRRFIYLTGINSDFVDCCRRFSSCHRFSHYDVVLFRDFYDLHILERLIEQKLDEVRLQHLFGIPTKSIKGKGFDALPVVVCIATFQEWCTFRVRENIMKSYKFNNNEYQLVLLGGTFENWIQDEFVIGNTPLSNIHYFNRPTLQLFRVLRNPLLLVIIHGPGTVDNTVSDTVFPFVAGGLFGKHLHLSNSNQHILDVGSQGCDTWDLNYLQNSTASALNRLFGFPPHESRFYFRPLNLSVMNKCENCSDKDITYLQNCEVLQKRRFPFAILAIEINVELGRDGQLCINNVEGSDENLLCLLRPVDYLVVERQEGAPNDVYNFTSFLRGSLFADFSREQKQYFFARLHSPWYNYSEHDFSASPRNLSLSKDIYCQISYFTIQ